MIIGVPRELAPDEKRVGLAPAAVLTLARQGHDVLVERGAGLGSGFADDRNRRHPRRGCRQALREQLLRGIHERRHFVDQFDAQENDRHHEQCDEEQSHDRRGGRCTALQAV
ncbi:hypothetical protein HGA89_05935, partial [bacterium]|nr:hypothetical protein [bacterium]